MKDNKILSDEELMEISGGKNFLGQGFNPLNPFITVLYAIKPLYAVGPIDDGRIVALYAVRPNLETK